MPKPTFDFAAVLSLPGRLDPQFQHSWLYIGWPKILTQNWSSLSQSGWALIERQTLLRILRDYYFLRMASAINSSAFQVVCCRMAWSLSLHYSREDWMPLEDSWELWRQAWPLGLGEFTGDLLEPLLCASFSLSWAQGQHICIRQASAFQDLVADSRALLNRHEGQVIVINLEISLAIFLKVQETGKIHLKIFYIPFFGGEVSPLWLIFVIWHAPINRKLY